MGMDQLDQLIAKKRQELKDLLFMRDAITHHDAIVHPDGPVVVTTETILGLALEPAKKEIAAPADPAPPVPPASRESNIAARVEARKNGSPVRRTFTDEQRLSILDEYDRAELKKDIIAKYQISPSLITNWKKKRAAGHLVPDSEDTEGSSPEGSDDEGTDLVSDIAPREAPADPFVMGQGRAPNFPTE